MYVYTCTCDVTMERVIPTLISQVQIKITCTVKSTFGSLHTTNPISGLFDIT